MLVLHRQTRRHLEQFARNPNHAVLLAGPAGSGKQSLAELLARQLIDWDENRDIYEYPYLHLIAPPADKPSIGIEAIRELHHLTALKLPTAGQRRVVVNKDAHALTAEAQNALLKLLEEPPAESYFILTVSDLQAMLPTIRSRGQLLIINQPLKADLLEYFAGQGYDQRAVEQAYFMSGGLPGLLHAILGDQEHPLKTAAATARQLLQSSQFERLCLVDQLGKSRQQALDVLTILEHMAQAAINQAAHDPTADQAAVTKRLKQWHRVLQASYDAKQAYAVSAQAKLTLTNLMLSL